MTNILNASAFRMELDAVRYTLAEFKAAPRYEQADAEILLLKAVSRATDISLKRRDPFLYATRNGLVNEACRAMTAAYENSLRKL